MDFHYDPKLVYSIPLDMDLLEYLGVPGKTPFKLEINNQFVSAKGRWDKMFSFKFMELLWQEWNLFD